MVRIKLMKLYNVLEVESGERYIVSARSEWNALDVAYKKHYKKFGPTGETEFAIWNNEELSDKNTTTQKKPKNTKTKKSEPSFIYPPSSNDAFMNNGNNTKTTTGIKPKKQKQKPYIRVSDVDF